MYYLGFDIETTGQSLTQHRIVAIGACLVATDDVRAVEPQDEHVFRAILTIPDPVTHGACWEPACFSEFWNAARPENGGKTPLSLLHELATKYGQEDPANAMVRFWAWLGTMHAKYPGQITTITDTVGYDAGWLNYYLSTYLDTPTAFHTLEYASGQYRDLRCTNGYYLGGAGRRIHDRTKGVKEDILRKVSGKETFPQSVSDVSHDHDPVNDATSMTLQAAWITHIMDKGQQQ